jgi:hypothetical protein
MEEKVGNPGTIRLAEGEDMKIASGTWKCRPFAWGSKRSYNNV